MNINEALEKLFALHNFGVKLGLENIKKFLGLLGNPQDSLKCFHIAGSNGKGSTSSFIASILTEAGFKVGLYTSPHFIRFNERIKINNIQINNEFVAEFLTKHFDYIYANGLTFFEVTTAIAFAYFKESNVDYAVIETGLGGRLDATNVITPLASLITSISLEHTNILGNTHSKIAAEKAGIIKPGVNVYVGRLPHEAEFTIADKCAELNSKLFKIVNYTTEADEEVTFADAGLVVENIQSPLRGEFQKYNAALATLAVTETLGIKDKEIICRGLQNVLLNTGLEGRYENYFAAPRVIMESAHNIEGVEVFLKEFKKEASSFRKKILLFGVMKDKSFDDMLIELNKVFDEIVFTEIDYERCAHITDLMSTAHKLEIKAGSSGEPERYITEFIHTADRNDCLVVLGSMYILGQIKSSFSLQKP